MDFAELGEGHGRTSIEGEAMANDRRLDPGEFFDALEHRAFELGPVEHAIDIDALIVG